MSFAVLLEGMLSINADHRVAKAENGEQSPKTALAEQPPRQSQGGY